jgi:AcrR family transcriptional regulator
MTTSSVEHPPIAHYRPSHDERTTTVVLRAALAELEDRGYDAASLRTIAQRADVPLERVFERWRSKQRLVHDAVHHLAAAQPTPDTGDLRTDVEVLIGALVDLLAHPGTVEVLRSSLISADAAAMSDAGVHTGILAERRAAVRRIVERGQRRQQVPASIHPGVVGDAVVGTVLYRLVVSGEPLTRRTTGHLVDVVLAATRQSDAAVPG